MPDTPASFGLFGEPVSLTADMATEYIKRIDLDPEVVRQKPVGFALLADLQMAHLLNVPFDTTSLHLSSESLAVAKHTEPVRLGTEKGISCSLVDAFHAVVQQRRGGFCFVCNSLFGALLRHLGFQVSEVGGRVNTLRNSDAHSRGFHWGTMSHMGLFVDADGERYLADVGYDEGGPALPVPLSHAATAKGLNANETFELRNERLPGAHPATFRDSPEGWTLYRHFAPTAQRAGFESACYHLIPYSLAPIDWSMLNYYNSNAPDAIFTKHLLVSSCTPEGTRKTFEYSSGDERGRYVHRDGIIGEIFEEESVEPTVGAIVEVLRRRLAYGSRPRTMSRIASA